MVQAVKITSLNDIGTSIMYTTLVPVVNMTGTPTTEKANLQIVGNLILTGAGGSYFPPAAQATVSQFVAYAAQPNITSVGTLTSLDVTGNINAGNANLGNLAIANVFSGTLNGSAASANIANTVAVNAQPNITSLGTLTSLNVTGLANLGAVTSVVITGGSPNYVLQTDGFGNLSWAEQTGGGGNTGNITFDAANISTDLADTDIQIIGNGTGNVNVVANSQTWLFNADGNLTIPNAHGNIGSVYNNGIDIIAPVGGYSELASGNLDNFIYVEDGGAYINTNRNGVQNQWYFDLDGNLALPDTTAITAGAEITLEANSTGNTSGLQINGDADAILYAHANIVLNTDINGTDNIWTFDTNGNLTLPAAGALTLDGVGLRSNGSIGQLFSQAGTLAVCSVTSGVQILADNGDHTWQFGSGGALTFPSFTYAQGNVDGFNNFGFSMPSSNGFAILANAETQNWTFGDDGNLSLPGGGSIYSNPYTPSGAPGNTITLQPAGSGITTNQKLMIYPTAGDGDHIHMVTGNLYETELFLGSDNFYAKLANTGDIVLHANTGLANATWTFSANSSLILPGAGVQMDAATNALLTSGIANTTIGTFVQGADGGVSWEYQGDGGDANTSYGAVGLDTGGTANTANLRFKVQLVSDQGDPSTNKEWLFDTAGNLTLPGNLIINGLTNIFGSNTALIQPNDDIPLAMISSNANGSISSVWLENTGDVGNSNIAAIYVPEQGSGAVRIINGNNATTVNIWDFGVDGNLTAPGSIITSTGSGGNISGANVITSNVVVTTPVAYSSLTAVAGARAFINNANLVAVGNFGVQVSGGGSNIVPVWSNGTNWYIG